MLIALLTILFLGGGTTGVLSFLGDTEDAVKSVVVDDDRRKQARATISAMEKRTKNHDKAFRSLIKQLKKEMRDHADNESDLDQMWEQRFELANDYNADMVDYRFELREQLTREEWEQVFAANP